MDKTKKYLAFSFVMVLVAVTIVSVIGMILLDRKPVVLQGQIEATEIRISGKLPGRIDRFLVEEGERVAAGDTLVVINSPEALAKYEQVQALEDVAIYQNQKIDDGTRRQIVESMKQLWVKAKADLKLARTTRERIESLYRDSVVTSQRRDEAEALYQNALAGERAAYEQYRMALDGARKQDRESARSMVDVARGAVGEVTALLQDARLTAPESGEIAAVYPERGELVGAGTPIMSLVVLEDAHAVLNVREDAMELFGFASRQERAMFKKLCQVTGVGAKTALGVLSALPVRELSVAIVTGDIAALSRAPGIGKKTAQRIVLELKDKVEQQDVSAPAGSAAPVSPVVGDAQREAQAALQALGYTSAEAARAINLVRDQADTVDALIMLALRQIGSL